MNFGTRDIWVIGLSPVKITSFETLSKFLNLPEFSDSVIYLTDLLRNKITSECLGGSVG